MKIEVKNLVSITEANQNFSKVVKRVEADGQVVVLKNNKPKYVVSKFNESQVLDEMQTLLIVAKMILAEHSNAFKELARWLNLIKKKFYCFNNL